MHKNIVRHKTAKTKWSNAMNTIIECERTQLKKKKKNNNEKFCYDELELVDFDFVISAVNLVRLHCQWPFLGFPCAMLANYLKGDDV